MDGKDERKEGGEGRRSSGSVRVRPSSAVPIAAHNTLFDSHNNSQFSVFVIQITSHNAHVFFSFLL